MDILQIVRQLRPGTAWNMRGSQLEQVDDETLRVSVPTKDEIDQYVLAHPDPIVISLEERISALELKVGKIQIVD